MQQIDTLWWQETMLDAYFLPWPCGESHFSKTIATHFIKSKISDLSSRPDPKGTPGYRGTKAKPLTANSLRACLFYDISFPRDVDVFRPEHTYREPGYEAMIAFFDYFLPFPHNHLLGKEDIHCAVRDPYYSPRCGPMYHVSCVDGVSCDLARIARCLLIRMARAAAPASEHLFAILLAQFITIRQACQPYRHDLYHRPAGNGHWYHTRRLPKVATPGGYSNIFFCFFLSCRLVIVSHFTISSIRFPLQGHQGVVAQ